VAAVAPELLQAAVLHRLADAMRHKPCGLESDAESAMQLVRADALFARRDQEDSLEPKPHRNVRCLEDGSDLHGEGLAALVALVDADAGGLALERAAAVD